jgi:hypothetical protein
MIKLLTICLLMATIYTANAQKIKNSKGESEATNEISQTINANPENLNSGYQYAFNVDFDVTIGLQMMYKTSYLIQIHAIKPNTSKGYYFSPSREKGKYYSCTQLDNLCDNLILSSVNIVAIWSYQGLEYKTGSIQLSSQNGSFLNCSTSISNPNTTAIPHDAVISGEAKVVRIEFVYWHFKNESNITEKIRTTFFK